jgi:hypothetical protein
METGRVIKDNFFLPGWALLPTGAYYKAVTVRQGYLLQPVRRGFWLFPKESSAYAR